MFDQIGTQLKDWLTPAESGEPAKAYIELEDGGKIKVSYNPEELRLGQSIALDGKSGTSPSIEPKWTQKHDLTVRLIFDTYEDQVSVCRDTDRIKKLTEFTSGQGARKRPPIVKFIWGPCKWYEGIVTSVEQNFIMFLPSGIPVRAEVSVTFAEWLTDPEIAQAEGLLNCRKLWTVSEGDRLYLIAQKAYGDATLWRLIADANGIYDVLNFPSAARIGSTLAIPDIHGESYEPKREPNYV